MSENEIFNMYFGIIEDNRCEVNVIHPLVDILKLVMIAVMCGMDELDKIIDYGENKKAFLEKEFNIKKNPIKVDINTSNGNDRCKMVRNSYCLYIE